LWLISSGPPVDNPQKYLNSAAMVALKLRLLQQPFFIVFDTPPIGVASEVAILNNLVSRFLLVLKAGYTNTFDLCKIIQKDFPVIEKKIIGVVLNMGETVRHSKFYKYY
jgi:Mrp family chromosome partitioning ATPase